MTPPEEPSPLPESLEDPKAPLEEKRDPFRHAGAALVLLAAMGAGIWVWKSPVDGRPSGGEITPGAAPSSSLDVPPVAAPRCTRVGTQAYRIGQNALADEGSDDEDHDNDERPGAFGAEISRAVALPSGFAVGVRHDTGSGAHAAIATIVHDAATGTLIDLGRSRGDFDAPLVVPLGAGWLAGLLEPNASGSTLRIGASRGSDEPKWVLELEQGRDESLAFDLAPGPKAVIVAWDEVTRDGNLARVLWSALSADGTTIVRRPSAASSDRVDAETPRLVAKTGGFWLAYIARKVIETPKDDDDAALERNPKGDREAAEKIDPSWIELMPLSETGEATGPARAVTPREGHALTFDLAATDDGAALLVWRDDDTPLGSHGGRVSVLTVLPSGGTDAQLLAEKDVGSGSPTLLRGWVALANAAGRAMLAPIGPNGAITGELRIEPAIGVGEPLVAVGVHVLTATSVGTAIDLSVVECKP